MTRSMDLGCPLAPAAKPPRARSGRKRSPARPAWFVADDWFRRPLPPPGPPSAATQPPDPLTLSALARLFEPAL